MSPRPTPELLETYYSTSENYAYWNAQIFPASEGARREKIFRPRAERMLEICRRHAVPGGTLLEVLEKNVSEDYFLSETSIKTWRRLKGAKAEHRVAKNGYEYRYTEGAIPFPDPIDKPSRTVMTSEGGTAPSRFKHVILDPTRKRYRILTPVEVERLNGFPDNWTAGMPERARYFCMGNSLVVYLVERMSRELTRLAKVDLLVPSVAVTPKKARRSATRGAIEESREKLDVVAGLSASHSWQNP